MDTDYLTRDAYQVLIGHSGDISGYLRAEIGSAAGRYPDEDSYLNAIHHFVSEIYQNPHEYLDQRNLLDEVDAVEFGTLLVELAREIMGVIETPFDRRGQVGE